MKNFFRLYLVLILIILMPMISCSDDSITVASKIDTEGALLGKMIVIALEDAGLEVKDRTSFGNTSIVRGAIKSGEVDLYPEYTGNGAFFFPNSGEPEIWKDAESAYKKVKELDYEKNKIVWLQPIPANNTWAIAVRDDLAKKENLKTLKDFARYVNNGGRVKLACSAEFVESDAALPSFQNGYGFELTDDQLLVFSGGNTAQTEKAAGEGIDGVNFAMAYGTDGGLSVHNLTILEDTKNIQPVYEPAPIVKEEVLKKYPEIKTVLEPIFKSLDMESLQRLNAKIAIEGVDASIVATEYLKGNGFIEE